LSLSFSMPSAGLSKKCRCHANDQPNPAEAVDVAISFRQIRRAGSHFCSPSFWFG
jgi:hypothetical protein